jgi:hypothetical protein
MRTPCVFRLTFLLPPALGLLVAPGRQQPCLHGCILTVGALGHVAIDGPSRERVFEQASRFLKANSKGRPGYAVAAHLLTPDPRDRGLRTGDSWSIIVGADVAFSPTALGPEIMPQEMAS